jgi:hypothetical protein
MVKNNRRATENDSEGESRHSETQKTPERSPGVKGIHGWGRRVAILAGQLGAVEGKQKSLRGAT